MNPIRIHLGPMPRMLRAIIDNALAAEQDFAIVGSSYEGGAVLTAARAEGADFIVTTADTDDPGLAALLSPDPPTVLLLTPGSQACVALTVKRQEISLEDQSLAGLAHAIRKVSKAGSPRRKPSAIRKQP